MLEIDLHFCGVPRTICAFVDAGGGLIVDPGPESCARTLLERLPDGWELRRILLTHIHFDHAGATGRLLERWPGAEVWVHRRGARHLSDPERLVASARRVYGDQFDRLWGAVVPVPARSLRPLEGGERLEGWRVAATPGHASHHVSYLREAEGSAFTGDVTGVRIGAGPVVPPTPPPDIDRELWLDSLATIAAWAPAALRITHFGTWTDVGAQIGAMRAGLMRWGDLSRTTDARRFADAFSRHLDDSIADPAERASYERANPPGTLWAGWDRYWSRT